MGILVQNVQIVYCALYYLSTTFILLNILHDLNHLRDFNSQLSPHVLVLLYPEQIVDDPKLLLASEHHTVEGLVESMACTVHIYICSSRL